MHHKIFVKHQYEKSLKCFPTIFNVYGIPKKLKLNKEGSIISTKYRKLLILKPRKSVLLKLNTCRKRNGRKIHTDDEQYNISAHI